MKSLIEEMMERRRRTIQERSRGRLPSVLALDRAELDIAVGDPNKLPCEAVPAGIQNTAGALLFLFDYSNTDGDHVADD